MEKARLRQEVAVMAAGKLQGEATLKKKERGNLQEQVSRSAPALCTKHAVLPDDCRAGRLTALVITSCLIDWVS